MLAWKFNRKALGEPVPHEVKAWSGRFGMGIVEEKGWSKHEVASADLKKGMNTLEVTVQPPEQGNPDEPAELLEVRVSITYS